MDENIETEPIRAHPISTHPIPAFVGYRQKESKFQKRFGMTAISLGRIIVVAITVLIVITGLSLAIASVATPAWQVVYIAEFQTEHQHGLWLDCTLNRRFSQGIGLPNDLQCTYKFESEHYSDVNFFENDVHQEEVQHMWHGYHRAVLAFFLIGIITGLISLCFLFCAPCFRISCIVANIFLLISVVTLFTGLGIFFINSHRHETRFVHGITQTYQQSKGYSFYLGVVSVICMFFAFLLSIPSTVLVFLHDRREHAPRKTFPNNKNQQQPISV